jgi:hypothetical protein
VLASVVIKIEYRRTLHQGSVGIVCQLSIPSFLVTNKPSTSSLPAAFLPGLPRAFFAKGSICSSAFLPGSAQQVKCDVTRSKQTTGPFLPGATTAPRWLRQGTALAVPSLVSSIEFHCSFRAGSPARAFACTLDPAPATVYFSPFLTGSASQTEMAVTHSKQTTETFLTGSRIACQSFKLSAEFQPATLCACRQIRHPSRPHGRP